MHRREWLSKLGQLALLTASSLPLSLAAQTIKTQGRLVIIGGAEDRKQDRIILRKFLELSGGPNAKIRVINAASGVPDIVWASYQAVFQDLGALNCEVVPMLTRDEASEPNVVNMLAEADGIFITGGDQNRLMQCLWESPAAQAMHRAFHLNGTCIAGTSAGAAVMSRHMLAEGAPTRDAFATCYFDEEGCKEGLIHLEMYRKTWLRQQGMWSNQPYHDTHSNGADAFRYMGVALREEKPKGDRPKPPPRSKVTPSPRSWMAR